MPIKTQKILILLLIIIVPNIIIAIIQLNNINFLEDEIKEEKKELEYLQNQSYLEDKNIKELNNLLGMVQNKDIYSKYNPTYEEAKDFILNDNTSDNIDEYDEIFYNCVHFSKDVNDNAEKQGLICGYVVVNIQNDFPHAVVAFNTTDKGIVFFEPQTDEEVDLTKGSDYWTQCIINSSSNDYQDKYGSTVESYEIYW